MVQRRAARWTLHNYSSYASVTKMLQSPSCRAEKSDPGYAYFLQDRVVVLDGTTRKKTRPKNENFDDQEEASRQAHDVNITSPQRRCNVITLHRR